MDLYEEGEYDNMDYSYPDLTYDELNMFIYLYGSKFKLKDES